MSDGKKKWYDSVQTEPPGLQKKESAPKFGMSVSGEISDNLMIQPVINGFIVTVISGGYYKDENHNADRLVFSSVDDLAEGIKLYYSKEHKTNESS